MKRTTDRVMEAPGRGKRVNGPCAPEDDAPGTLGLRGCRGGPATRGLAGTAPPPSIVDHRDVEAALGELRFHPRQLVVVVVGAEAHAIAHALVGQRAFLHARLPGGERES